MMFGHDERYESQRSKYESQQSTWTDTQSCFVSKARDIDVQLPQSLLDFTAFLIWVHVCK